MQPASIEKIFLSLRYLLKKHFTVRALFLIILCLFVFAIFSDRSRTIGTASWYGKNFHLRKTANGEIYNKYVFTAAHRHLPFNTMVNVINLENSKTVVVRINDRGPYWPGRIIDLSRGAAEKINMRKQGLARVKLEIINP